MATSRKNQARTADNRFFAPSICSPLALACRFAAYMNRQDAATDEKGRTRPYTMSGLYIAARVSRHGFSDYINGMHDERIRNNYTVDTNGRYHEKHITELEQNDIDALYYRPELTSTIAFLTDGATPEGQEQPLTVSHVFQKAKQLVAEQDEERLKIRGQVADIAVMKMCHGWIEEERRTIVHKHEVLPSNDEALEVLKQLQLLP